MRNLRFSLTHWYTYRSAVGVILGLVLGLGMFWLYSGGFVGPVRVVNLNFHPEDRLFPAGEQPSTSVVIVGIDDLSLDKSKGVGQRFPFSRDVYATAIDNLVAKKVSAIVFDIQFSEPTDRDAVLHTAIANAARAGVPVILAYGQSTFDDAVHPGKLVAAGPDQLPLRTFRCADASSDEYAPCRQPISELGSTAVIVDEDGVVRRMPMFVEPACHVSNPSSCPAIINPLGMVAYRDFLLGKDAGSVRLEQQPDGLHFGQAWKQPLYVDGNGAFLVSYSGGPGNLADHHQYHSFSDVYRNQSLPSFENTIALIGSYNATGLHDDKLVPSAAGDVSMNGVEIHANVLTQFLLQQVRPSFVFPEPGLAVLLTMLVLGMLLGLAVSRVSVVWGAAFTVGLLAVYTVGMIGLGPGLHMVPNLFHVWLTIALTYVGVTAYRFLYEDREKRKVTQIFGQYLKPELVSKLAAVRSVDQLLLGGERRELTLFFVDIRGFTSMSETMDAADVLAVTGEYLTDLTKLIFKWDGTVDKYVGDEIVAIWNAPHDQENHALLAIRCAYDIISHAPELQKRLLAMNLPPIRYGIGINTGPAVVGNMGSPMRRQYTALGDTVNTAARFCGAAGPFELLIGEETYQQCKDYIAVELRPDVQLKGKSAETFRVYKVIAIRETPQSAWVQWPTDMATQTTYANTQQYRTQQTMLSAGATVSADAVSGGGTAAPASVTSPEAPTIPSIPTKPG